MGEDDGRVDRRTKEGYLLVAKEHLVFGLSLPIPTPRFENFSQASVSTIVAGWLAEPRS